MLLMFLLLVFVSQHASGVEVEEGEEYVLLPCQVPAGVSSDSAAAVWDREELKASIVHVRLQSGDDFKEQNVRYTNRTSMRADALQTGDLSLTLRNPTVFDSGTYTCITRRGGEDQSKTEVQLKVKERLPPPVWPTVILALLCPLVPLVIVFGLFVCLAHKKKKKSKALQPEVVAVPQGEESVLLPFKTTAVLPQDATVEWRHDNMKVYLYESGNNQPDKQDQEYTGRTETNEDPLRTKDLSLTLKDLRLTDSGFYTCTVYNKNKHVLLQKVVSLRVRALQPEVVEVTQGDESVLLPFKTRAALPNGIIVEWRLTEPKHMKVHVYESGKDQPDNQDQDYRGRTEMNKDPLRTKDLSLTFKDPRFTDSGVYTCTVYNKDGFMLLQKVVTLSVRVPQQEVVAVTKSVLLPFQPTADLPQDIKVEWTLTEPKHMKVHVYESGKDQPDKQDQDYRGRTEMKVELLKNGDFSLTLKDLQLTDSGVYTCTVYNKDGEELLQKSVILGVKDDGMELVVSQGLKFVLLPFKIPHDLPQGTTVEWRHNYVTVYKYTDVNADSQHQDFRGRTEMNENPLIKKDLSLTLKDLHLNDSGVYTCIVHKDGRVVLQKVVRVRVRDSQPKMVEVKQGLRSVLLPFQTTSVLSQDVTVEWRLIEPRHMVVHVYESGKHHPKKQNQVYRGRTEMNKEPLENGDLSLTLKDLHLTDSGVYTCTVYNKDRHVLLQKSLILSVRATLKGAMADMLPRLRRRKAPEELRNRNQEQEPLNAEERV